MTMKLKHYIVLLGAFLMASCDRGILVHEPAGFEVTTERTTYSVGEEITFRLKGGDAQRISFYSGEALRDYEFRSGRVVDVSGAGATMAFTSSVQVGTQANQLAVLASTDYKGDDSFASVKAATWTDITDRFALGTTTAFLASGTKDISDLVVPGKPVYIAFKYVTKPQANNGLARQWFIQGFDITSKKVLDASFPRNLANQENAGFRIIDELKEHAPARALVTATRVTLYGNEYLHAGLPRFDPENPTYNPDNPFNPASPYNDPLSEHWAISKPIYAEEIDLGPDLSVSIKSPLGPTLEEYAYTYTSPGTYRAVFIVSNNSIDHVKSVKKEVTLTITP